MSLYARKPGSSLLEQLMVLGVILFIAALIIPPMLGLLDKMNEKKTQLIMAKINGAIARYTQDMGHAPTSEEGGLKALIKRPAGPIGREWQGSYLPGETTVPLDGFKKPFRYASPPRKFKDRPYTKYELYSEGADENDESGAERLRTGH